MSDYVDDPVTGEPMVVGKSTRPGYALVRNGKMIPLQQKTLPELIAMGVDRAKLEIPKIPEGH